MPSSVGNRGDAHVRSDATSPPVVIAMPDDGGHLGADEKVTKTTFLAKYTKGLNYSRYVNFLLSCMLVMVGVTCIVLAVRVCKDQDTIQKLNHEMGSASRAHSEALEEQLGGRMSYLDGFSGMTADDDDTVAIAARDVMASNDPAVSAVLSTFVSMDAPTLPSSMAEIASTETTCTSSSTEADVTVSVLKTTTILPAATSINVTQESTAASDTIQTTLHTQMTTTVLSNTNGTSVLSAAAVGITVSSADALSGGISSSIITLPAVSITTTTSATWSTPSGMVPANPHHCLEFGDGAGPCDRPYGAPNTPPSSLGTIVVSINTFTLPPTTFGPPSVETVPETASSSPASVTPSASSDTGALSGSTTTTDSTLSAMDAGTASATASITSVCGPPTTIYVTLGSSTDTSTSEPGLTVASLSIGNGTDGGSTTPSTVTSTSTSLATTYTVSLASVTETISNSSATTGPVHITTTATGITLTMQGNGTYSPTYTSPTTIATLSTSGGGKVAGKPMGASGNGGTGNGLYCAVMLVTILALSI
ncbi:hypothetical protein KVR01_008773 [Diaporthe batatas]|uniref:uncharacterized protein n=1 Tax=Diaporthe batatas TaxID=748121 RepID=UPI001D03869E|nr:uncharacterized protein KVR01_008773 [Diaporthe batatas]KAG8161786.1 hypothetical protein KVR01_008773 [Diaporthe batatas]